ncbi:putative methyltransferase C9orf114 homolog [Onthophagus taurus]|uniref:putative methyltransferase C9orf114 homolog n=1 Tax=Onthophagus taurus TaxID=166361 RepID=UPI000C207A0C|nr:putative methyltransferase C9orf114 homolog [Onthophagus taurus]
MAPINAEKRSLKEIKAHKAEKKKWKEQNLIKKYEKQQLKEQIKSSKQNDVIESVSKELPTISIAIPGSILENAQSLELRTYLAGQIARAACVFQVDEVVVFDDYGDEVGAKKSTIEDSDGVLKTTRKCCAQLGRILQYLECPQYLRKFFFPIHKDLQYAGVLNPLDAPHHLRQNDVFEFREGVVTNKPVKSGRGSQVNIGLLQDIHIDKLLTPGIRCTVKLLKQDGSKKLKGLIVPPKTPKIETGVYWGYEVRLANSLSQVLSQCPYKEGYDLTIGTSDKGTSIDEFESSKYKHALIVFGGLNGLEAALENDNVLNIDDPSLLFDHYLNTIPNQGSRTIRTEEAVLITLTSLRTKLNLNIDGRKKLGDKNIKDLSRFD